ncbi:ATP-binding protein [Clostridium cadaveris]|uniref:ATP-binding protein n=1 Tax=Clostridium cadaveris TaxID=1529 RepID=UPI000420CF75|nr:ATP-binding protein [Clostridium cadaveris]
MNKRSAEATIAGYLYQFDKSIIEILKRENDGHNVTIEGIEDIDIEGEEINSTSIQVKYYEGSEYNHSIIAEAIRYLFYNYIDYLNGKSERRYYYLYGYYSSGKEKLKVDDNFIIQDNEGKKAIDILKNNFLTYSPKNGVVENYYLYKLVDYMNEDGKIEKRAVLEEELNDFISLLRININAKSLDEQYEELLSLIEDKIDNCKSRDEAEKYYYNNALKVVFKLAQEKDKTTVSKVQKIKELNDNKKSIIAKIKRRKEKSDESLLEEISGFEKKLNNLINQICDIQKEINDLNIKKRTITKKEFIKKIDQKTVLFNKWYAANLGKRKYNEYVKDVLYRKKSLNNTKYKYLILGKEFENSLINDENISIDEFVNLIIEDSYKIDTAFANKDKPWSIVLDVDAKNFKKIIERLNKKEIKFNSGREEWSSFSINNFNEKPIVNANENETISNASYQIRIITLSTFEKYLSQIKEIDVAIILMKNDYDKYIEKLNDKGVQSYVVDGFDGSTLNEVEFLFEKRNVYKDYFRILSVTPTMIQIEVIKPQKFKNLNENFTLGSYIKITDENNNAIIGILKSYKIKETNNKDDINIKRIKEPSFILDVQPVGHMTNGEFKKGNKSITIPPSQVEVANEELLKRIFYLEKADSEFSIGDLAQNPTIEGEDINVIMDGNKFFNKHLAVVGSTGSGKSCTVAKILQEGIKPYSDEQKGGILNNSHIVLFDLHGEYQNAFKDECRHLEVGTIKLPYWLMNSEELEDYFLDVEGSDHNQRNIFKKAVTLNKKWHNVIEINGNKKINNNITYDSSVYFNIKEVLKCIENYNIAKIDNGIYKWEDKEKTYTVEDIMPENIEQLEIYSKLFTENLFGKGSRAAGLGFTNFISRLENKICDDRLNFLLKRGKEYRVHLSEIIKQFIGYETDLDGQEEKKNITIIDLSGMPFEVINIVVALVSRLIFKFAFERKKVIGADDITEVPFLLVYEEAHNYIPKSQEVKYKAVRKVVERIAKEGRKYGVSAMIVSQRPSEISETIFSQCNSFVVMRLTNPVDQSYIKKLLPEDVSSITDNLAGFDKREALVLGDAVKIPALIKVHELPKDSLPKSNDINFIQEWRNDWYDMDEFDKVISQMMRVVENENELEKKREAAVDLENKPIETNSNNFEVEQKS